MPLHQLAVAPADVDGTRLGLALNAPAPPPLASCRLDHPDGGALMLGVLGASHVVAVEQAAGRFSEQVSCTARGHGGDLPERADAPGYHLESRTETHDEATFRRLARELRDGCARKTGWLGGVVPRRRRRADRARRRTRRRRMALADMASVSGAPGRLGRDGGPHDEPVAAMSRNRLF